MARGGVNPHTGATKMVHGRVRTQCVAVARARFTSVRRLVTFFCMDHLVAHLPEWEGARAYLVVDVFTDTPLFGNPLGVFLDGQGLDGDAMQRAARELNLSESVFFLPPQKDGDARVRIFTPSEELPFAGHPVLGAGVVVGEALGEERVTLETGAGRVCLELEGLGSEAPFGRMTQPIPEWAPYERADEVLEALGLEGAALPVEAYRNGPVHVMVALESREQVAALQPDMTTLSRHPRVGVSCFAGEDHRWTTRMFTPALGVPEDPATGSAAGPLALHLARHGWIPFGQEVEIRQGEAIGRPSLLRAAVHGDPQRVERVEVGGQAVVVARGLYRLG